VNFRRDLHFYTKTTIDTLDYSGDEINEGSKLVVAAFGEKVRDLIKVLPPVLSECKMISKPAFLMEGVVAIQIEKFTDYNKAKKEIAALSDWLSIKKEELTGLAQVVIYDDFNFSNPANLGDYLWITYTRSNPSHDIYGVEEEIVNKHWGCEAPMIIDARKKPHHAPELKVAEETSKKIERFFRKGASLEKYA
jgi:4-hydroxy-3-polyprenylbenzoate decarboxylase